MKGAFNLKKWMIIIGIIICVVAVPIIFMNLPSTSTIGDEMENLQEESGEIQALTITHHTPPQGNADIQKRVDLEDPEVIQQLIEEAAPTKLEETNSPPPAYDYSIATVTPESSYQLLVYEEGFSINNSDHFTIEGDNLLIQAIENADYEWREIDN